MIEVDFFLKEVDFFERESYFSTKELKEVNFEVFKKGLNKFNVYGRCRTVSMVNMVKEIKGVMGV